MKAINITLLLFLSTQSIFAADECISGEVILAGEISNQIQPGGKLFVYVREHERESGPPTAVVDIENPEYPQSYKICADDQMLPMASPKPLNQQYKVYARHSPNGTPMVKEGFFGTSSGIDNKGVSAGETVTVTIREQLDK